MKKLITSLFIAGAFASANAYQFQLDIGAGDTLTVDGVNPMTGSVFIGYFDAGTNFADPFASLDAFFNVIGTGGLDISGNTISLAIPAGGSWPNGTLQWDSQEPADWETTFNGQDILAVFTDRRLRGTETRSTDRSPCRRLRGTLRRSG